MEKKNNDILIRVIMAAEVILMWFFYFWKNKYLLKYEGEYLGYTSSLYKVYKYEPQILFLLVTATVLIFIGILSYKKISYWTNMAGSLAMLAHVIVVNNAKLNMFLSRNEDYKQLYKDDNFVIYERNV